MPTQHTATRRRVVTDDRVRVPAEPGTVRLGIKHCRACDTDKPVSEFYRSPSTGRVLSKCIACRRRISRAYYHDVAKGRRAAA